MIKTNLLIFALFLVVGFGMTSCNPGTYKPLFKWKNDVITDTLRYTKVVNSHAPASDVYRIQVDDILSVRNTLIEQIDGGGGSQGGQSGGGSQGFHVEADGNILLPKIGLVHVQGLTRKEATDLIQGKYRDKQLVDPVIDVSVLNPRVTVLGEVSNPGVYFLDRENVSLVEILGQAGGFSPKSEPSSLKIIRGDKADPEVIYVNLRNLSSLAQPKITLQNHDVIYVEPDKRLAAYEKSQTFFSIFQSVLVVLSTGLLVYTTFFK